MIKRADDWNLLCLVVQSSNLPLWFTGGILTLGKAVIGTVKCSTGLLGAMLNQLDLLQNNSRHPADRIAINVRRIKWKQPSLSQRAADRVRFRWNNIQRHVVLSKQTMFRFRRIVRHRSASHQLPLAGRWPWPNRITRKLFLSTQNSMWLNLWCQVEAHHLKYLQAKFQLHKSIGCRVIEFNVQPPARWHWQEGINANGRLMLCTTPTWAHDDNKYLRL